MTNIKILIQKICLFITNYELKIPNGLHNLLNGGALKIANEHDILVKTLTKSAMGTAYDSLCKGEEKSVEKTKGQKTKFNCQLGKR